MSSCRTFGAFGIGPIPSDIIWDWCDRQYIPGDDYVLRRHIEDVIRLVDNETLRRARAQADAKTERPANGGRVPSKHRRP